MLNTISNKMNFLYSGLTDEHKNCEQNNVLVNKAFSALGIHELFIQNGWDISINKNDRISFYKRGFELSIFDIEIQKNKIYVSVPIRNSPFQYKTSFTDYTTAFDYIEKKFYDFND